MRIQASIGAEVVTSMRIRGLFSGHMAYYYNSPQLSAQGIRILNTGENKLR